MDETPSPDLEMDSIYHDQRAYYRPYPETSVAAPKLPAALMAEPVAQIAAEPEIDAEASAAARKIALPQRPCMVSLFFYLQIWKMI